ncbi:5'-deoxynucleotidase HDDC2 isoform X3 [Petaurus breviceps papuanus]|uniref:5'-deoxynucleotidase HDDC2 isoform X3 n=1 Tax=Petaurus breviceps papuanus TaxID=3040969 RepID=UPI0036DC3BD4
MASARGGAGGTRSLLQFLRLVGQLKVSVQRSRVGWGCSGPRQRVPRTGWVYRNVEKPESVSDHMYRMAIMAFVTEDKHLNKDRCVRLALVHDMAECIVGDIAPADNIPKEEKHRREKEYENQSSAEAKFVKQLDQCEMILQAFEYEDLENKPGRLQEFYDSTAGKFSHPEIVQLVSELTAERNAKIAAGTSEPHP